MFGLFKSSSATGSDAGSGKEASETHYQAAIKAQTEGRPDLAERGYQAAIAAYPAHADALHRLAFLSAQRGDAAGAESFLRKAIVAREDPDFVADLGNLLASSRRSAEAEAAYRRSLELRPGAAVIHGNLAVLLQHMGRGQEAEACFRRALELDPQNIGCRFNLARLHEHMGQAGEAEAEYRQAIKLKPDLAEAHYNLGNLLHARKDLAGAEAAYRRALHARPAFAQAAINLATVLQDGPRPAQAEKYYRRALELDPDSADARFNLGWLLLRLGRYAEGWKLHEGRPNKSNGVDRVPDGYPEWHGEPLAGKSLVIWPEQGYGDCIQFFRFASALKQQGLSQLTLVSPPALKALAQTIPGVDSVITNANAVRKHDYWCFPLSIPLHLGITLETIPAALPYMQVPAEKTAYWRGRLPADGLKIGLIWKGNPAQKNDMNRSLPSLETLAPLWAVPGLTFVSLQKGRGEDEARLSPAERPIMPLGGEAEDFSDTAAIMMEMDLIISVCTAGAHLAGALGKPCWTLIPAMGTDWRWLLGRDDSPWYPGVMRLYRQRERGDWKTIVDEMSTELRAWAAGKSRP